MGLITPTINAKMDDPLPPIEDLSLDGYTQYSMALFTRIKDDLKKIIDDRLT